MKSGKYVIRNLFIFICGSILYFRVNPKCSSINYESIFLTKLDRRNDKVGAAEVDLSRSFVTASHTWVIVTTVSEGFMDMFENWYFYFTKLELKLKIYVIAEDIVSFKMLEKYSQILKNGGKLYS